MDDKWIVWILVVLSVSLVGLLVWLVIQNYKFDRRLLHFDSVISTQRMIIETQEKLISSLQQKILLTEEEWKLRLDDVLQTKQK